MAQVAQSSTSSIKLEAGWLKALGTEFNLPYMKKIKAFLQAEKNKNKVIYPKSSEIFQAFNTTAFNKVKVVILGQDPYHGPNQAHGLSFSVKPDVRIPPSLLNMYKELDTDLGIKNTTGYLLPWAEQGVFLLNSVLTVEATLANSHQGLGWEQFTDKVIEVLNEKQEKLVFVLWGSYARKKGSIIDKDKHSVLESTHPSPLSAHRGFFGCKHFSQINAYLKKNKIAPINWKI